jgi:hypothetical protein
MKKTIAGVVLGLIAWIVVATIGNRLLRAGLAGYAEVETTMAFTQSMMVARLLLGAVSSLCAGYVAAWTAGSREAVAKALALVLLAIFIPLHYALWAKFPAWYHVVFLTSLVVLSAIGATLRGSPRASANRGSSP